MAINLNKALDKSWEAKSLGEILNAKPSALAGLTPEHDKILEQLGITSVRQLGEWKFAQWAQTLVEMQKLAD